MEDEMVLASRLRKAMEERGIDRTELRRMLGCSYSAVNAWVVGDRVPTASRLADICRALDVSADWLLGLV